MMLRNIPTVANMYAMKRAQPAVKTHRTRLIVKIGSLFDQTIRRWMLYHMLLIVGAMPSGAQITDTEGEQQCS